MSPLAGPVAAAAVIFASGTRIPKVDDSKRLTAEVRERLAPGDPRARARLGGRVRRGRRDRLHQHLLGRAGGDAAGDRVAVAGGGAPADRRAPAARRGAAAAGRSSRATRRACRSRRRRSSPRPRATRGCARFDDLYPGYGFCPAQGLPRAGALPRASPARPLPDSPAIVRGGARGARPAAAAAVAGSIGRSTAGVVAAIEAAGVEAGVQAAPVKPASAQADADPAHSAGHRTPQPRAPPAEPMSRNIRRKLRHRGSPPSTTMSRA